MLTKVMKNRNKIGIMGAWLINEVLAMFLNTFMIAYFLTLTNYNYKIISIYSIASYAFISVGFFAVGKIVKNISQIYVFRTGIILIASYVLILALLKEKIVDYYLYLGIFYGLARGVFWLSAHTLINEYVGKKSDGFISIKSVLDKVLKIMFPIIFGVSIEVTSFSYIASVVLILSSIQIMFSFLIKDETAVSNKKYSFKKFYKKYKNNKLMNKSCILLGCNGVVVALLDTLVTIMIIMTFKTTISLGFLTTIFSVCSIVSVYIFNKKVKNKKLGLSVSALILVLSVLLVAINTTKLTIIIYNLSSGLFLILLKNAAESKRYNIVDKLDELKKDLLVEYHIFIELYVNIFRIIGYAILGFVSIFNNAATFNFLLILMALIIYIYYKFIISVENEK